MGSSVWSMFFWMSSSGPGRWLSWSLSWSASLAFFSIRCRSARLGSTWPTSSRMCCRTSSSLPGLCWIFAFSRSPVFALSSCLRCSWNAGGVFNAACTWKNMFHVYHITLYSLVRVIDFQRDIALKRRGESCFGAVRSRKKSSYHCFSICNFFRSFDQVTFLSLKKEEKRINDEFLIAERMPQGINFRNDGPQRCHFGVNVTLLRVLAFPNAVKSVDKWSPKCVPITISGRGCCRAGATYADANVVITRNKRHVRPCRRCRQRKCENTRTLWYFNSVPVSFHPASRGTGHADGSFLAASFF